ncbi:MAG: hypothetical protein ACLTC4_07640 [Hungatella hathewayi]
MWEEGRFLDDIINYVFLICGESAWQLPAHNSYIRDTPQFILPDVTRPVVDLFAAETGAVLGVAEYLLRDAFADISPAVSTVVNENLEKRIFRPYLEEHFWWMGDGESHMNNWTSWCTQNVLLLHLPGRRLMSGSGKCLRRPVRVWIIFWMSMGWTGAATREPSITGTRDLRCLMRWKF